MYDGDSFLTLTLLQRVGLAGLSVVFALAALAITRVMTVLRPMLLRPPIWAVLFISFVWASPQGCYAYYRLIIDGLPAQSVIGDPPRPEALFALLTFRGPATLSAHSLGILGWAMLVVALLPRRRKCRDAAN